MNRSITDNIAVEAKSYFQEQHSAPNLDKFIYSYNIIITNLSDEPVQLISRKWEIINAFAIKRKVEGMGVIGQQPVIMPGEFFEYNSWSPMNTEVGLMRGSYKMRRLSDKSVFEITIPRIELIVPFKNN